MKGSRMNDFSNLNHDEEMLFAIKIARIRDIIEAYEMTKGKNYKIDHDHLMYFLNSDYYNHLVKKV